MTLGLAQRQGVLLDDLNRFCEQSLPQGSVYGVLNRERDRLFPDEMFADLFSVRGRRSVPPCVVATVMVLQRLEGLSDRVAVERYALDARWRFAAGVGGYDTGGWVRFAHTVLVDMRARLAASQDPRRIFRVALQTAGQAGLVRSRRVLDSTPLYDAVATMDTITLVRSALRGLLKAAGAAAETGLGGRLRAVLRSGDGYADSAKPQVDWDDAAVREQLIDSRARDGYACLAVLHGRKLDSAVQQAAQLLATVLGQDLDSDVDGVFRIARRVAKDRVISTVDRQTRHGHKTSSRGFDGYKGHVAVDPDSEIITDTKVSAGNVGDAAVAADLIGDLLADSASAGATRTSTPDATEAADTADAAEAAGTAEATASQTDAAEPAGEPAGDDDDDAGDDAEKAKQEPTVYGDAAYGSGAFQDTLAGNGIASRCKTQPASAPAGRFAKDRFDIDLERDTVSCPAGQTADIRRDEHGDGIASFAKACADYPSRAQCTTARTGRTVNVGRHEQHLADARTRQQDPDWVADYKATRPKVERKLSHLMRRQHGGRRDRVRGQTKIDADFNLLSAAHNIARLAVLNIRSNSSGWAAATA